MRAVVLACSFSFACSEVTIVPNDGGGSADVGGVGAGVGAGGATNVGAGTPGVGGAGGEGGAPPAESRLIELALVAPLWGPIEDVGVLVNSAYGELRASYSGSELPVMAEVVDGDLVSFYVPSLDGGKVLRSYRVRPAVWRIAESGPPGSGTCDAFAPMSLTFDIPVVAGASQYSIHSINQTHWASPGVQTIEVDACTTDLPLQLLVVVSGSFLEPIAYDLVELPYQPGGAAVVPSELVTAQQDLEVMVDETEGDVWVNGWWMTDTGLTTPPWAPAEWQPTLGGYAGSVIAPGGGFAWVNALWTNDATIDGWCTSSANQQWVASAPGAVVLDGAPPELAQPVALGGGAFAFADAGPRGDVLWQSFRVDPDAAYNWMVYDDPWAVETPLVFPLLPPGDPWGLEPGGSLPLAAIGHEDSDVIDGYADNVAKLESAFFSPTRSRNLHPCD